jgi:hypothetical protein
VRRVDARRGYTVEFSHSPEAHRLDYDEEEARLAKREKVSRFYTLELSPSPSARQALTVLVFDRAYCHRLLAEFTSWRNTGDEEELGVVRDWKIVNLSQVRPLERRHTEIRERAKAYVEELEAEHAGV